MTVAPTTPKTSVLKRAWKGFLTAVTSSVAVKEEKNIAVVIVTGVLLSVGATDGLVQLVTKIIENL